MISVAGGAGLDYEHLLATASDEPLPVADGDDLATLNFSGGTTGTPKAAMLRHRNLVTVARTTIRGFDIGEDGVFLNVRPLWPIAQVILMSHLFAGATVVLARFDPATLADDHRAQRRNAHVAGADPARSLARSPRAARSAGLLGCRRSTSAARAFRRRYSSGRCN